MTILISIPQCSYLNNHPPRFQVLKQTEVSQGKVYFCKCQVNTHSIDFTLKLQDLPSGLCAVGDHLKAGSVAD